MDNTKTNKLAYLLPVDIFFQLSEVGQLEEPNWQQMSYLSEERRGRRGLFENLHSVLFRLIKKCPVYPSVCFGSVLQNSGSQQCFRFLG